MTGQGLRAPFENELTIDDHVVVGSILPVWSLTLMIRSWAAELPAASREEFLEAELSDRTHGTNFRIFGALMGTRSTDQKNFELASAAIIF